MTKYTPEGFNEFMISWTEAYDEFEMRFEDVSDAGGERVVTVLYQRGRPHGSQAWVDFRIAVVWTVAEGQVKRGQLFRTLEAALEAVERRE